MEGRGGGRTKQVVLYFFNTPFSLVCLASIHVPLARTLNYKGGWEEWAACVFREEGGRSGNDGFQLIISLSSLYQN